MQIMVNKAALLTEGVIGNRNTLLRDKDLTNPLQPRWDQTMTSNAATLPCKGQNLNFTYG